MDELTAEDRAYLAGFAAGATLVLLALWLNRRGRRRRTVQTRTDKLECSVAVVGGELAVLRGELEELKSRIPQEVAE